MAHRYYTCGIIGTGTEDDPYRPEIADNGVAYACEIPSDEAGHPRNATCVVAVDEKDDATVTKIATVEPATDLTAARTTVEASSGDIRQR